MGLVEKEEVVARCFPVGETLDGGINDSSLQKFKIGLQ